MSDRDGQPDRSSAGDKELTDRLRDLDRRLDRTLAGRESERQAENGPPRPGMALGFRLAADFTAGILLGAALGWGFDRLFNTSPWGLAVFLLLGFAAGVLTLMRSAGLAKPGPAGPDDRFDRKL